MPVAGPIKGRGTSRRIDTIAEVHGLGADGDYLVADLISSPPTTGEHHVG